MQTISAEEPKFPSKLYHYTGPAACIGIIKEKKFWATQIQYMNDSKEIRHAVELATKFVHSDQKIPSEVKEVMLAELEFITKGVTKTFVVSFSEHEDLLSQWRAYCPNGGASIGFSPEKISKPIEEHPSHRTFRLVKCIYKEKEQDEEIEKFFQEFREKIDSRLEGRDKPMHLIEIRELVDYSFGKPFTWLAAQMKHASFSEEAEWRLVGQPAPNRNFQWRPGSDMVIPYYEYSFAHDAITSLCAGPAKQPEDAMMSLYSLAKHCNVRVTLKRTETPYRKN